MALTGKTIGQLTYLSGVTTDTLFPVELSGDTYHIAYSAFTNSNYNEGTYDELNSFATGGTLTAGSYYLMTDFQTCYDQPNYNSIGEPITTGNYKTGTTEPILLLAISTTQFSPIVYSTLHPQDKISYDITFNTTEITGGPAKGRITERIDDKDNRADYDFRAVQFIRYVGYFSERYYSGKINLDATTGLVSETEIGTSFTTDFTVGDILGVYYPSNSAPLGCFQYYEVTSIVSNTEMYVTGRTLTTVNNVYYSAGQRLANYMNPFQCNITGTTNDEFAEYYTFNEGENFNTYLGDNINFNTFLLSNNVFLSASYNNNTFGGNVVGNTFNDDMDSNIIGPYCQYNIITNDFDRNIIGSYFQANIIDCDMESNQIDNYFEHNMLGDNDGQDFDFNRIGSRFSSNFLTLANNDFYNNNIGYYFYNNLIDSGFRNNEIFGNFYDNLIRNQDFENNTIGNTFYLNNIPASFNNNVITGNFYSNNIYNALNENSFGESVNTNIFGDPNNIGINSFTNNTIGGDFIGNDISGNTQYNTIGFNCNNNTVYWDIQKNTILTGFEGNTIGDAGFGGTFEYNQIANLFKGNNIQGNFLNNQVKTNFKGNDIQSEFSYNNVGYYFSMNTFDGAVRYNNIGDDFEFNNCYGSFEYNTIGTNFYSNEVQDGFGVGGGSYQGNRIGNNFYNNNIGEYFYNNTIPDNFTNNTVGNYFQWNAVNTYIGSVDFTVNYGNITDVTFTATGTTATDGTYTEVGGTTAGSGVNAKFTINVSGNSVTGVTVTDEGRLYLTGETITVLGSQIGGVDGADNVIITVTDLGPTPAVYEEFSCNIFKNTDLLNRVSYINNVGTMIVDDIVD
jgi:hypothetical protein